MAKLLVVVDMQNDFIDGVLGSESARAIVPNVCKKIANWDGDIITTLDNHESNYPDTVEGSVLPAHCVHGEEGWKLHPDVALACAASKQVVSRICKPTFGSVLLAKAVETWNDYESVEFVGLCTDICVISNVLLVRAHVPNIPITVDASCCAGVSEHTHYAALDVMKSCLINVINDPREEAM